MKLRRLVCFVAGVQPSHQACGSHNILYWSSTKVSRLFDNIQAILPSPTANSTDPIIPSIATGPYISSNKLNSANEGRELSDIDYLFSEGDIDGSGELDNKEFQSVMENLGSLSESPTITPSSHPFDNAAPTSVPPGPSADPASKPFTSLYPSVKPSQNPSFAPRKETESPTTPNPTAAKSLRPTSKSMSRAQTAIPSGEAKATMNPTGIPSKYPSTGQSKLLANTTIALQDVSGMMDDDAIEHFEGVGLLLLNDKFPRMDAFHIDFLFLQVEGQVFQLKDGVGDLTVYVEISATITPAEPDGFDFQSSMDSFFEVHEDLLATRLAHEGVVFQSNSVQEDETAQKSQGNELVSSSVFHSVYVIVGISVSMAMLLFMGALVLSKPMWRRNDRYSLESPGRLGATPSDDVEDLDPQSIFMSFSSGQKQGTIDQMALEDTGVRSLESHHNSSTSGSHLDGLEIDDCLTGSSVESKSRRERQRMSTMYRGQSSLPSRTENFEDFRSISNSVLEDLESHLNDFSGISAVGDTISSESLARQRKRELEKKYHDNRRLKQPFSVMPTVKEHDQPNESPKVGLSMKDFLVPSCTLAGGGYQFSSHGAQLNSLASPESCQSIKDKEKMTSSNFLECENRMPIDVNQHHPEFKVYNTLSDFSETFPETDSENDGPKGDHTREVETDSPASIDSTHKKKPKWLGWFRKIEKTDKQPPANLTKARTLALFGPNKYNQWDEIVDIGSISPNKSYRRGERGQLVPRCLNREPFVEDESQISSSDADPNDPSVVLLPGPSSEESEANSGSFALKIRPPMLNLNDLEELEETYHNSVNVEEVIKSPSTRQTDRILAPRILNGQGVRHGRDPDGFALTNANKRLPEYKDPPTASEHRRAVAAQRVDRKSSLRVQGSSQRPSKNDRVKVRNKDDAVFLGVDSI